MKLEPSPTSSLCFGKLAIGHPKAVLFALASGCFCTIVCAVEFLTVETRNLWKVGQQLAGAFRVFYGKAQGLTRRGVKG
jgi:hypothetical protein